MAVTTALCAISVPAFAALERPAGAPSGIVTFVGDSNEMIAMSAVAIAATQHRRNPFVIVNASRPGAGIRGCVDTSACTNQFWANRLAAVNAAVKSDAYVVDLGINDTVVVGSGSRVGYSFYGLKIDWMMRLLRDKPVFWTNLPCALEPATFLVGCLAVNRALAAAPARSPNLVVLDWASAAAGHPEWIGGANGMHLTAAGQTAWATFVQATLDRHFPAA